MEWTKFDQQELCSKSSSGEPYTLFQQVVDMFGRICTIAAALSADTVVVSSARAFHLWRNEENSIAVSRGGKSHPRFLGSLLHPGEIVLDWLFVQ